MFSTIYTVQVVSYVTFITDHHLVALIINVDAIKVLLQQSYNTMCGDMITLVSMMYIITYTDSIVGIHSFIPATQEPIQNWRYLNYQNVCKT